MTPPEAIFRRQPQAPRRGWTWWRRALMWTVMLGTALGIVVALGARGPVVRTTAAVRKDMEQHIVASGRVRVPARVQIAAQLSGLVVEVTAVEGQHVRAGDLLVRIEDAEELAAVAQAKANVAQAGARVDQLRRVGAIVTTEGMRQAHTVVERAESDLTRARKLAEAGGIAPAELDEAVRAADIARAQHAVADAQQVSSSPMGADSRVALAALRAAQAQLQGADVRLARTRVVALHDGVILTRACETGDVVQAAQALLTLAVDGETQLVFQADERDIGLIAVGQKAAASADGYPDQVFDAAVLSIAPSIDPQRGSVEVRLGVSSPPSFLKPEMTVSIDLTVGAVSNGLTLASSAVRGLALSVPWVYAVEDGHVVRHDVKLGLRGEDAVQIVDGLAEGAQVVVSDGRVFAEGQRVRAELE